MLDSTILKLTRSIHSMKGRELENRLGCKRRGKKWLSLASYGFGTKKKESRSCLALRAWGEVNDFVDSERSHERKMRVEEKAHIPFYSFFLASLATPYALKQAPRIFVSKAKGARESVTFVIEFLFHCG